MIIFPTLTKARYNKHMETNTIKSTIDTENVIAMKLEEWIEKDPEEDFIDGGWD